MSCFQSCALRLCVSRPLEPTRSLHLCHVSSHVRSVCVTSPVMCVPFVSRLQSCALRLCLKAEATRLLNLCHVSSQVRYVYVTSPVMFVTTCCGGVNMLQCWRRRMPREECARAPSRPTRRRLQVTTARLELNAFPNKQLKNQPILVKVDCLASRGHGASPSVLTALPVH